MGNPAARVGDMHTCPMVTPGTPPVPHVGGPAMPPGNLTVLIGGIPAATLGNMCTCVGPPDIITKGSMGVIIEGKPASRIADSTAHGGVLVAGCPTVLIGGVGSTMSQTITFSSGSIRYGEIIIEVDPLDLEFQARVLADLIMIDNTPTGRLMLQSLSDGGGATIISTSRGNSHQNGVVSYNPYREQLSGTEPWSNRPPAIGLAHELIHADHTVNGNRGTGMAPNDSAPNPAGSLPPETRVEELNTAGIPPHTTQPYSENTIRSEWNTPQPQRLWY